jgi:hypothetical protein
MKQRKKLKKKQLKKKKKKLKKKKPKRRTMMRRINESTESENGKLVPVAVAGDDSSEGTTTTTTSTTTTTTKSSSKPKENVLLDDVDSEDVLNRLKDSQAAAMAQMLLLNENDNHDHRVDGDESSTSTTTTSTSSSSSTESCVSSSRIDRDGVDASTPTTIDGEASVTDATELMNVNVDVDVDTDDTVRLTMVISDSDTESTPSTRSTPVFSETALVKVASQLLLQVPQGSFLATRYRDDRSELLRVDPHTGDVALIEQFEPLYKITALLSNPHTGEIYAFVNDMRAKQEVLSAGAERRRGGLYDAPPMLVRIVEQGGWHVVCDNVVRRLDVDSSSTGDEPDRIVSRRQPRFIADAKFDPTDEKHIYAYDAGLKMLGSVRIDHCAFRAVGRPGGDDDEFDNSLAFAHAAQSEPVIYFSRFQEIWRLNDSSHFERVAHTARYLVAPELAGNNNEHLLTSMDFDHTNGLLFGILSEVDDDRVRLATRLVRIDPSTGAMVVIGESDVAINSFAIRPAEHAVGLKDLVEMLEGSSTSSTSTSSSTSSSSSTTDSDPLEITLEDAN